MTRTNKATLHDNNGYSLVEMIITIAIIVIMSGISFVTVSMINSAKAKDASVTFESELSDMITKTKNQVCIVNGKSKPSYSSCLMIYKASDNNYYVKKGYYNPAGSGLSETNAASVNMDAMYIFINEENLNDGKGKGLSSRVKIGYRDNTIAGSTEQTIEYTDNASDKNYIVYDRNGRCLEGYGIYRFYKKNGNVIADVTIQKNGSHQSN